MGLQRIKLVLKLLGQRTKPYPIHKYISKSKYNYIYRESINDLQYWRAHLDLSGVAKWEPDFYSDSEEECALWVYNRIKKHLRKIIREDKKHDNKTRRRHINWQIWLLKYQHWQYPKKICELKMYK
jgi:hypothetical protein